MLAEALESVVGVVADVLEQVLVEHFGGCEGAQAVGHEDPATLAVLHVLVPPRLVRQLAEDLVPQLVVAKSLVHDVVAQNLRKCQS